MPTVRCFLVAMMVAAGLAAQSGDRQRPPQFFMGLPIIVTESKTGEDGHSAQVPVSFCLDAPPQRHCYAAPKEYVRHATVEVVQVDAKTSALLVSAASDYVSGWDIHYALLQLTPKRKLENILRLDSSLSNQSQHRLLKIPEISEALILVTADWTSGLDETRWDKHRSMISAYMLRESDGSDSRAYFLEDRYMTARKYDFERDSDIISSEQQEIFARLTRVLAERFK